MCNDFDCWLRAARDVPLPPRRRRAADPLPPPRRELLRRVASSPGARRGRGRARKNLADWPLDDLVPELDWAVLPRQWAERRACLVLAEAFAARDLPALASDWRARADQEPRAPWRPGRRSSGQRIVLSSFGFADAGGGTIVPRYVAKELAQRGHDVTVFAAGVARLDGEPAYASGAWSRTASSVVSVHNRPHGLLDLGHPHRELDDPPIRAAFAESSIG